MSAGMNHPNDLINSVLQAVEAIPHEERAAYDEAMEKVPNLVMEESDPQAFARFAVGDMKLAATRLVAFWYKKKRVFEDRFLLPLNLSGEGALTFEDVETLRTGFISFLPDDNQGRKVIYFDNSKGGKFLDGVNRRSARFRCLFYMSYLAAKEGKPILLLRYSNTTKMYLGKAERVFRLFNSLPVQLDLFLNLYQAPPGARRMFQKTVVALFEDFPGKEKYVNVLKSFVGDSPEELRNELSKYGLTEPERIPPSSGGTWQYSTHESWFNSIETAERASLGPKAVMPELEEGPKAVLHELEEDSKPPATASRKRAADARMDDLMLMKARAERKRMMDRKYSEQRRQREKQEESTLYKQYVQLNASNKKLRQEESELVQLLAEAQRKVVEAEQAARTARQSSLAASISNSQLQQLLNASNCVSPTRIATSQSASGLANMLMRQQQQETTTRALLEASMANTFRTNGQRQPIPSDSVFFLQLLASQGSQPQAPAVNSFLSATEDPQQRMLRELLALSRVNGRN